MANLRDDNNHNTCKPNTCYFTTHASISKKCLQKELFGQKVQYSISWYFEQAEKPTVSEYIKFLNAIFCQFSQG